MTLRRGFKTQAKSLALEVREELGLAVDAALDTWELAATWGIRVYAVTDLADWGCAAETIAHYAGDGSGRISAALVPLGSVRVILENDTHSDERRRSNLAHEMAHVILEHDFGPQILTEDGCRAGDPTAEEEAAWFGSELLIPTDAAIRAALYGHTDQQVARRFLVSEPMARMRMNASGARRIAARTRQRRG